MLILGILLGLRILWTIFGLLYVVYSSKRAYLDTAPIAMGIIALLPETLVFIIPLVIKEWLEMRILNWKTR